jgi:hypothetical protein
MPVPMRLRDEKNRKTKKYNSNPTSFEQTRVSSTVSFVLEYPEQVEVLQNASLYARVVEPVKPIVDKQNKYITRGNALKISFSCFRFL